MSGSESVDSADEVSNSQLDARLRPGSAWNLSLLGPDESLDEVLARDADTLERVGITYDELADALDNLVKNALQIYLRPVIPDPSVLPPPDQNIPDFRHPETIPHYDPNSLPDLNLGFLVGHLQVFLMVFMSWVDCPWGCPAHSRCDFMIVNRETGQSVTGSELMPHLIRTHHFFGGLGSPYRSDPEQLANVLGIKPGDNPPR